jgi:hypothetical protein
MRYTIPFLFCELRTLLGSGAVLVELALLSLAVASNGRCCRMMVASMYGL